MRGHLPRLTALFSKFRSPQIRAFPRPPKPGGYIDSCKDIQGAWQHLCWDDVNCSGLEPDTTSNTRTTNTSDKNIVWANVPVTQDHPLAVVGCFDDNQSRIVGHPPRTHELLDNKGATSSILRRSHPRFVNGSVLWESATALHTAGDLAQGSDEQGLGYLEPIDPSTLESQRSWGGQVHPQPSLDRGVLPDDSCSGDGTTPRSSTTSDAGVVGDCLRLWGLDLPVVGKPVAGRGSEGVSMLRTTQEVASHCRALARARLDDTETAGESNSAMGSQLEPQKPDSGAASLRYGAAMLVEEALPGQEMTIAVMPPGLYFLPWPLPAGNEEDRWSDNDYKGETNQRGLESQWWMHPRIRLGGVAVCPAAAPLCSRTVEHLLGEVWGASGEDEAASRVRRVLQAEGMADDYDSVQLWGGACTGVHGIAAHLRGWDSRWQRWSKPESSASDLPGLALCEVRRHWALPPVLRGGPAVGVTGGDGGNTAPGDNPADGCVGATGPQLMPYNGAVPVTANSRCLSPSEAAEAGRETLPDDVERAGLGTPSVDLAGGWLGLAMADCEEVAQAANATAAIRIDCRGTVAPADSPATRATGAAGTGTARSAIEHSWKWPFPGNPYGSGKMLTKLRLGGPVALFDVNSKPNATGPQGQYPKRLHLSDAQRREAAESGEMGAAGLLAMAAAAPPIGWSFPQLVLNSAMQARPAKELRGMKPGGLLGGRLSDREAVRN